MSKKLLTGLASVLAVAALALVPTTAQSATPPTVETKQASSVTQTSATLNGTVNPNGSEVTECKFEYGRTTSYGQSVNCNIFGFNGTTPFDVHSEITGLTKNTTYHFRISATNAGGTSKGADLTFTTVTTLPPPPTVETTRASSINQTSATLNGSVNPNGAEVSECKFEYGTTTSYGSSVACSPPPGSGTSPVAVSASVTGLTPNTTYHFRISATNIGGTSRGSDATFATANPAVTSPTVETKQASSVTQTSATLNGTVNANGSEVTECKFEYGRTTSYGQSVNCNIFGFNGTTPFDVHAEITGLTKNTTYHFRISATNAGGTSKGADETLTTPPNAPTVSTEAASAITQTVATLNGSVNPNGAEVSECRFEYGTTTSYGSSVACSPPPGSGTSPVAVSASVTGLTPNTTYHFRISATNVGGTSSGTDRSFSTPTPATPGGHYYVNGTRLREGAVRTFIAWGNITFKGTGFPFTGGHVTCHYAIAGTLFNPEGGGAGEGTVQAYAPFACEQENICPTGTTGVAVTAENLPWHDLLTEEVAGTIRQETTGIKIDIACREASTIIAELKFGTETPEKGLRPKVVEGTEVLHPGLLEFDSGSGELGLGGRPEAGLKPEGALKLLGYNAQELIAAKNP